MELNCTENNGVLFIEAGDREFSVRAHEGRDAVRARRQVKKLVVPQIAEMTKAREEVFGRMSQSDKARHGELLELLRALGNEDSESKSSIEEELNALVGKYRLGSDIAKASASAISLLDLDQEQLLDDLLLKNTKARVSGGKWGRLNNPETFDLVFAGKHSALIDEIRDKVIDFNGFLDL